MKIALVASECAPWVTTGGLGAVVGPLSRQLAAMGHDVSVYLPCYRQVRERLTEKKYLIRSLTIPFPYYSRFAGILDGGKDGGVQMYFVDCPELFDREFIYGAGGGEYRDNWERYGLFCRAVLEASKQLGVPEVFHVHDWPTALLPVYLRVLYYFDSVLRNVGTVLTIHNAGYQGLFPPQTVERLLFPWDIFTMDRVEYYDQFNFLKGGIAYADRLTTVSPRYAQEIQTAEFGEGLEGILQKRGADLTGILNGVDYSNWDPATDGNIAAHYTPANLAGKAACRRDLLHAFGAAPVRDTTAVLGIVSRLTTQKGIDLLEQISDDLMDEDVVLCALGTGELYYENLLRSMAARFPGRVLMKFMYDEALAHKVEAGSDIFLMPSRYEPCGLSQFYSMRYATVPVVRATGGLEDTVQEWDEAARTGTGFKFQGYRPEDFLSAIQRALAVFRNKDAWQRLMLNGMAQDYSWPRSAAEYVGVYERVARARS